MPSIEKSKMGGRQSKNKRLKTISTISKSQHVIPHQNKINKTSLNIRKTVSQKKINSQNQLQKKIKLRHQRSITTAQITNVKYPRVNNLHHLLNPYEKFVKQLNIVLPTPKQKFYEFMQIAPFNRVGHHIQLIQHFLKQYKFFNNHPSQLLQEFAKKVRICNLSQIQHKLILVVENGQCMYNKQCLKKGDIIGRKQLKVSQISCSTQTKFIVINRHQYHYLVSCHLQKQKQKYRTFLSSLQLFKMFSKKAFDKFMQCLTLNYYCQDQHLYKFGEQASHLFIVYKGKAVRRVIVQIDKTNKIPLLKYSKIVKILSKSYEYKIQFLAEDFIGISQVIDHIETRKQNINIQDNSIILGLDKHTFQQNLDEYIVDRLRKYNLKKYPVTYDKLCQKYEKQKNFIKESQQRKIQALKNTINNQISDRRTQKINSIIRKYQENIKKSQIQNLIECKIQFRNIQRE